ncbi:MULTISPECIES: hypothetical protein [unclassified Streptomyces]|uniref:hypothetical protein n=1 Tax=unclassified Streptomyces TaxID=2593676 RepID=UPI002E358156|nr:hypothetical protein [Streptomyces sp. NBC_01268]
MGPVGTIGLDGSPEIMAAARWAADETERRTLTLRLMRSWPVLVPEPAHIPSGIDRNHGAKRLAHQAQTELQELHAGLVIVSSPAADDAEHALQKPASEFEPTVLGSLGRPHG